MTIRKTLDVRLIHSSLVATFANANPPLIWRFDLERNHSFTLAMQGDEHEWELGVTSPKGDFNPVARFSARDDAEDAFAAVGAVLAHKRGGRLAGFFKICGIVVVVLVAIAVTLAVITHLTSPPAEPVQQESYEPSPTLAPPPTAQGVPVPADEVLKPPAP